jgi:hypothetical protein
VAVLVICHRGQPITERIKVREWVPQLDVELDPRFACGLNDADFARRLARLLLRLYPHHNKNLAEATDAAWWRMRMGFHIWQKKHKNEFDPIIAANIEAKRRGHHGEAI